MIPIERWGQADELAKVMLFLSLSVSSVPVESTVVNRPSRCSTYRTGAFRASVLAAAPKPDDGDPNTAE